MYEEILQTPETTTTEDHKKVAEQLKKISPTKEYLTKFTKKL